MLIQPRRDFLRRAALGLLAAGPLASLACGDGLEGVEGEPPLDDPEPQQPVCRLTARDQLGPYYRANAPLRTLVAAPEEPGTRLFISGRVFGADCATALAGA